MSTSSFLLFEKKSCQSLKCKFTGKSLNYKCTGNSSVLQIKTYRIICSYQRRDENNNHSTVKSKYLMENNSKLVLLLFSLIVNRDNYILVHKHFKVYILVHKHFKSPMSIIKHLKVDVLTPWRFMNGTLNLLRKFLNTKFTLYNR